MLEADDLGIDKVDRKVKEDDDKNADGDTAGNGAAGVADLSPEVDGLLVSSVTKGDGDKSKPQRLQKTEMLAGEHTGDRRMFGCGVGSKKRNKQQEHKRQVAGGEVIWYGVVNAKPEKMKEKKKFSAANGDQLAKQLGSRTRVKKMTDVFRTNNAYDGSGA